MSEEVEEKDLDILEETKRLDKFVEATIDETTKEIAKLYSDYEKSISGKLNKLKKADDDLIDNELVETITIFFKEEDDVIEEVVEHLVERAIETVVEMSSRPSKNALIGMLDEANLMMAASGTPGADNYRPSSIFSINKMFNRNNQDIIDSIINGNLYRDNKSISDRIWSYEKQWGDNVQSMITTAIKEGKSAKDLTYDLTRFVKLPARRSTDWGRVYPHLRNTKAEYNAMRLARTVINHSYQESTIAASKPNPFIVGIKWVSAEIHDRTCELCFERANTDQHGLGVGVFPKDKVPLDHPNGLCTMVPYLTQSMEDIADELRDWAEGKIDNPALDKWYNDYREELGLKPIASKIADTEDLEESFDKYEDYDFSEFDEIDIPEDVPRKYLTDEQFKARSERYIREEIEKTMDWNVMSKEEKIESILYPSRQWVQSLEFAIDEEPDYMQHIYRTDMKWAFERMGDKQLDFWVLSSPRFLADLEYKGGIGAHYSPSEGRIRMDILRGHPEDEALKYDLAINTFFHEAGHFWDYYYTDEKTGDNFWTKIGSEGKTFRDYLNEDYNNHTIDVLTQYVENYQEVYGRSIEPFEVEDRVLFDSMNNRFKERGMLTKGGVSDIFEGISDGDFCGTRNSMPGHGVHYHRRAPGQTEVEAVAHMFQSNMQGGAYEENMKEYFPEAYDAYLEAADKQLEALKDSIRNATYNRMSDEKRTEILRERGLIE